MTVVGLWNSHRQRFLTVVDTRSSVRRAVKDLLHKPAAPVKVWYITSKLPGWIGNPKSCQTTVTGFNHPSPHLPLSSAPEDHASYDPGSDSQSTHNGHPDESLFCNLVVNQSPQAARLEVRRLVIKQEVIITPCFCVVAEFVVTQRQVVETFPSPFR